ncbi:hypothetical protein NNJEOMEG_01319 [Fundidesulfovibrio magnetotacticus]|uniref:Tetratricopeptide repeat protein n=1 Tax=Fundidesulfovibrio magnetotacticus TaxID=2730080 RepID=A0A6V8LUJ7_9BACT|nr:tetratricopeptide repeat protein [Fundidesulfovibrio magnetotacticus]GFK93486.1 hypothetical protein NNJEOMEG_01319 [Fundidesulfovibrio magnetotacticus]
MSDLVFGANFKVAVSDKKDNKLGMGGTAQTTARQVFYFARREDAGDVEVRALNGNFHPSGEPRHVSFQDFLERYRPEPLVYFNKVQPAMETVESELERGEGQLAAGRPDLAEKSFKKVLDVDEDNIRGVFGLGMAYLDAGKAEDAEGILGKLMNLELAFTPEHVHLFNRFGIQMRKAGMLTQALDYYNKALGINPDDEHLLFNVCRIHYDAGDVESALCCIGKAMELNPDFSAGGSMFRYILKRNPHLADSCAAPPEVSAPSGQDAPAAGASPTADETGGEACPVGGASDFVEPHAQPAFDPSRYEGLDLENLPWEM